MLNLRLLVLTLVATAAMLVQSIASASRLHAQHVPTVVINGEMRPDIRAHLSATPLRLSAAEIDAHVRAADKDQMILIDDDGIMPPPHSPLTGLPSIPTGTTVGPSDGLRPSPNVQEMVSTPQRSCREKQPARLVELALAYDNTFCAAHGNNATKATTVVTTTALSTNEAYERSTCLRFQVVHVEGHCEDPDDPYALLAAMAGRIPSEDILIGFQSVWNVNRTHILRDLSFFFTGFKDNSIHLGRAFIGAACWLEFAYGWVERANVAILAHELGHSVGCRHTEDGLMRGAYPNNGDSAALRFSNVSVNEIVTFADGLDGRSCIGRKSVPPIPPVAYASLAPSTTPSATPACQPRAMHTPKPSKFPDPTTPKKARTCADAFIPLCLLACTQRHYLGTIELSNAMINVVLTQEFNRVDVHLNLSRKVPSSISNRTTIGLRRYGVSVSMSPVKTVKGIELTTLNNLKVLSVVSKHSIDDIVRPAGMRSCCWKTLYVNVVGKVVKRNPRGTFITAWRFYSLKTWEMRCIDVCKGAANGCGEAIAMSSEQQCPVCLQ